MQSVNNKKAISKLATSGIKSNIKKFIVMIGGLITEHILCILYKCIYKSCCRYIR